MKCCASDRRIFQDFAHYQLPVEKMRRRRRVALRRRVRWRAAAEKGSRRGVHRRVAGVPDAAGKWFRDGRELSGGQWQKIALSRAFMRTAADVGADEPTCWSALNPELEHFRNLARSRITILISHRFSTVRMPTRSWCWSAGA
jgi:ATP-binding cassette subfamily B protein